MNRGILLIILSGLSFLIVNFFVKLLGSDTVLWDGSKLQTYPAHELVLARSIVSFAISAYVIQHRKIPFFGHNKKWLIIRGLSGTIALTIFFYTLHFLPLAVASTVQYLSPIFTVLQAIFLVGERVLKAQWMFILISFTGVLLMAASRFIETDDSVVISPLWLGLGVLSAGFSGIAYNAIVRLKPTDEAITIVLYFPMIAGPIMALFCFFDFTMPKGIEWLILLAIGVFTQIAQILLTKALHAESTSIIMPFQYLGAIYALILGYLVFDERLSFLVLIGIATILLGVIGNVLLRRRKQKV